MVHLAHSILIQEVIWPSADHIVKYSTTADITTWTAWAQDIPVSQFITCKIILQTLFSNLPRNAKKYLIVVLNQMKVLHFLVWPSVYQHCCNNDTAAYVSAWWTTDLYDSWKAELCYQMLSVGSDITDPLQCALWICNTIYKICSHKETPFNCSL